MTDFEMLHIEQSDEELVARSEIDRRKRGIARALLPHLDVFTDDGDEGAIDTELGTLSPDLIRAISHALSTHDPLRSGPEHARAIRELQWKVKRLEEAAELRKYGP